MAAEKGMVVTAQHLATEVGVDILKRGGNAIDAAVAVGYALAVVYPAAGNDMSAFDEREKGYVRVEVPRAFIEAVSWQPLPAQGCTRLRSRQKPPAQRQSRQRPTGWS